MGGALCDSSAHCVRRSRCTARPGAGSPAPPQAMARGSRRLSAVVRTTPASCTRRAVARASRMPSGRGQGEEEGAEGGDAQGQGGLLGGDHDAAAHARRGQRGPRESIRRISTGSWSALSDARDGHARARAPGRQVAASEPRTSGPAAPMPDAWTRPPAVTTRCPNRRPAGARRARRRRRHRHRCQGQSPPRPGPVPRPCCRATATTNMKPLKPTENGTSIDQAARGGGWRAGSAGPAVCAPALRPALDAVERRGREGEHRQRDPGPQGPAGCPALGQRRQQRQQRRRPAAPCRVRPPAAGAATGSRGRCGRRGTGPMSTTGTFTRNTARQPVPARSAATRSRRGSVR